MGELRLMYGTSTIAWSSKKQPRVALSTTQSVALTSASKQLLWTEHLFQELDLASSEPPHLLCDNL